MSQYVRYHLGGYNAAAPAQNRAEQIDNTGYTSWDQAGNVTAQRALTAKEAAALAAQDAGIAAQVNGDDIRAKALQALAANATFLAIPSPTQGQVVAQVQRLTKECTALIRQLYGQLDTTDGT